VCELDIIFNFEKAYFIFDEFILGGEIQETSKKCVLKAINDQDVIQEVKIFFFSKFQTRRNTPIHTHLSNINKKTMKLLMHLIHRMINYKKYSMNTD
jgi:hypothetical protein